jgi:hypothetical protein
VSRSWPAERPRDRTARNRVAAGEPDRRTGHPHGSRRRTDAPTGLHQAVGGSVRRRAQALRPDGRGVRRGSSPMPTRRSGGCWTTCRTSISWTTPSSSSSPTTAPAVRADRTDR